MGRVNYDSAKVEQALSELQSLSQKILEINDEISQGINVIRNAKGANYLNCNYTGMLDYAVKSNSALDELMTTIRSQVEKIEEYQSAPWYKKLGATLFMGVSKLGEGIASVGETLVDGVAGLVGFVGGIFDSDFKNAIGEFISTDYVGDFFSEKYEATDGALSWAQKYSIMSHDGTAANILKGVGSAVPAIALAIATGGSSVGVQAAAYGAIGISGAGSKMQSSLQAGNSYNKAFGQGLVAGATDVALLYGVNKATKVLKGASAGKGVKAIPQTTNKGLTTTANVTSNAAGNAAGASDDVLTSIMKNGKIKIKNGSGVIKTTVDGTKLKAVVENGKVVKLTQSPTAAQAVKNATVKVTENGKKVLGKASETFKNTASKVSKAVGDSSIGGAVSKASSSVKGAASKVSTTVSKVAAPVKSAAGKVVSVADKAITTYPKTAATVLTTAYAADKVVDSVKAQKTENNTQLETNPYMEPTGPADGDVKITPGSKNEGWYKASEDENLNYRNETPTPEPPNNNQGNGNNNVILPNQNGTEGGNSGTGNSGGNTGGGTTGGTSGGNSGGGTSSNGGGISGGVIGGNSGNDTGSSSEGTTTGDSSDLNTTPDTSTDTPDNNTVVTPPTDTDVSTPTEPPVDTTPPVQQPPADITGPATNPTPGGNYTPPTNNSIPSTGGNITNPSDNVVNNEEVDSSGLAIPEEEVESEIEILDDNVSKEDVYVVEPPKEATTTNKSNDSGSGMGTVITGIGLAGAAGIGAKYLIDKKKEREKNEESDEYEDDYDQENKGSLQTDSWQEDDNDTDFSDEERDYEYPIKKKRNSLIAEDWEEDSANIDFADNNSDYEYPID